MTRPRRLLLLIALLVIAGVLLFVHLPIPPTYAGRTVENAGHTPLFFLVTLGILFVLRGDPRISNFKLYLYSFLAGAGAGLLTEVIQRPLARDASWEDVGADVIGTIAALAAYALFERRSALQRWHRVVAMGVVLTCLSIYLVPIVNMTQAYLHRNGQFPVLADFHSRTELFWTMSLGVRRDIVDDVMEVEFYADEFPGLSFHEPVADWRAYKTLLLDVENPADEPLNLGVRVHDFRHNRQYNDRFNRRFVIAAHERRTLAISLEDIRKGPRNRLIDLSQVSDITLLRSENAGSRRLRLHSMRLQ